MELLCEFVPLKLVSRGVGKFDWQCKVQLLCLLVHYYD